MSRKGLEPPQAASGRRGQPGDAAAADGSAPQEAIPGSFIEEVCARLTANRSVRRNLPGGGVLNIDRPVPFLCVYRRTPGRPDPGTPAFVRGEAAYLSAPGNAPVRRGLRRLIRRIAETSAERFGAFLIVEVWAAPDEQVVAEHHPQTGELLPSRPGFRLHARAPRRPGGAIDTMHFELERIELRRQKADVWIEEPSRVHPRRSQALLTAKEAQRINCSVVGLEILPVYRGPDGAVLPGILDELRPAVGQALKKAFFSFSCARTNLRPHHFLALSRRRLAKRVWEVDGRLASIAARVDLLLRATPMNVQTALQEFQASGFEVAPRFLYRPLAEDCLLLKRELFLVPTERIADPTMAHLLRQTQDELDRTIGMLSDVDTPRFLPGSLQVFGDVDPALMRLARRILRRLPPQQGLAVDEDGQLDSRAIARRAAREIRTYRRKHPGFEAQAEVRADLFSGLMASKGNLLIGRETTLPPRRLEALMAHEIGTHLVTFYNGRTQPMRLLATGLAGYDELQEGLAVFAEYLSGGLSRGRLRVLAARVLAAERMLAGVPFPETYRLLTQDHGFRPQTAYTVTMRVYRGGGLTKDAVYLRGLVSVVDYAAGGGELELLHLGKLALGHVPIVWELLERGVLKPPPLSPLHLHTSEARARLARVRRGIDVIDMVCEPTDRSHVTA